MAGGSNGVFTLPENETETEPDGETDKNGLHTIV